MKIKVHYLAIILLIFVMFSLTDVTANDNVTLGNGNNDIISTSPDTIQMPDSGDMNCGSLASAEDDVDEKISLNEEGTFSESDSSSPLTETVSGNTFKDIQNTIDDAISGETIFLDGQYYNGNNDVITINKNIIIDGSSSSDGNLVSTLDANNLSRIFYSAGTYDITLRNLVLKNGYGYFAYFTGGKITLKNIVISDQYISDTSLTNLFFIGKNSRLSASNITFANNTIISTNAIQGVLFNVGQYSNVMIDNLNFYNNNISSSKGMYGGAIYLQQYSNATINNFNFNKNRFESNSLFYGGGLYAHQYSEVYLTNVTCDDNIYAMDNNLVYGGLIFGNSYSKINISDIAFNHNNATGYSYFRGMIRLNGGGTIILDNLQFYNNYFYGDVTYGSAFHSINGVSVDMRNIFIENNYVGAPIDGERFQSGFIGIHGRGIVSDLHTFNNTVAKSFGGIVRLGSITFEERIILENSTFSNTRLLAAELDCDAFDYDDHGGIVCVAGEDTGAIIRNCHFENNFNSLGGALAPHNHCLIENCVFINNTATKFYGGAISTFYGNLSDMDVDDRTITVKDCYFEGNTAPLGGAIQANGNEIHILGCTFVNNSAAKGGAVFIYGNTIDIHNSTFIDNSAHDEIPGVLIGNVSWDVFDWDVEGGAIYIYGSYSHLFNNTLRYNVASGKESKGQGGAIYVHGNHTLMELTHFDDNFAYGGNGSAVYVYGFNTTFKTCEFFNHTSSRGTIYIFGNNSIIQDSTFEHNNASNGGGAIYIYGDHTLIDECYFNDNNATIHGGAIHTHGDYARIVNSEFYYNNAVPHPEDMEQGLGGAVFILGNNNEISQSIFDRNTARNGSAIYNRGENLHITDDDFLENQAFSYLLITTATPQSSYYNGSNQVLINITLIGGDNIINAIYHDDIPTSIFFHNVTYEHSTGIRTTTDSEIHPVDGAEKSQGGKVIYQDSREDSQIVSLLIVKNKESNSNILSASRTVSGDVIVDTVLKTGLYGNATFLVNDNLSVGTYSVYSEHPEDRLYKQIENETQFRINPQADLELTKSVSNTRPNPGDLITWTIKVVNKGPTYSQNVSAYDKLPEGLIYVSDDSNGKYDKDTGKWSIGDLDNGASAVLNIKVIVRASNTKITNDANVTSDTYDPNESNNNDSETIIIPPMADVSVVKDVSKTDASIDDIIVWTITVTNHGPDVAENVLVSEVLPSGLKLIDFKASVGSYRNDVWNVGTLKNGSSETLELTTKVSMSNGVIKNVVTVTTSSYDPKISNNKNESSVRVSSQADLEVVKKTNVKQVKIGDTIIWTITVTNNGPHRAVNVVVTDRIISGLVKFISSKASKGYFDSSSFIWLMDDLEVGETAVLQIVCKALSSGQVINYVTVTSDANDPIMDNNEDNATVEVMDEPSESTGSSNNVEFETLPATGNPLVVFILALFSIIFVGLKRKN